jgi:hypothetical protein
LEECKPNNFKLPTKKSAKGKKLGEEEDQRYKCGSSQCSFAMNIQFCGLKSLDPEKKKKKKNFFN